MKAWALLFLLYGTPLLASAAEVGHSYTPIVGYDDKNGLLFGAAAFRYLEGETGFNQGVYAVSNGNNMHSLNLDLEGKGETFNTSAHGKISKTFDNYYGEGDQTLSHQGLRIGQDWAELELALLWRVDHSFSTGPFAKGVLRRETGVERLEGGLAPVRAFDDSTHASLGWRALYDTRDSVLSSTSGRMITLDIKGLPGQAEAEWREFFQLPLGLVWGHRASAGASLGEPEYTERYSLGGTELLRGFQDNRFRGRQFYCVQEELRIPIWKALSGAASVDLGDIGDGRLERTRHSLQAGLRFGLPPSYGKVARLDFGFGDGGERSLALQFGQTF